MKQAGVLVHVLHLETQGWERVVWGVPEEDSLGRLTKVVELLLGELECEPVSVIVIGCGPSAKDGVTEGEYSKRFLLNNLDRLKEFPRFADKLDNKTLSTLRNRLEEIVVTDVLERSIDEVVTAARIFANRGVGRVYQVTAASHAPRCIQIQSAARAQGLIPKSQQWMVVADDRCYEGFEPFDTAVLEPPHRGDDPMLAFSPSLPQAIKDYHYGLTSDEKKELITLIDDYIKNHAKNADVRSFGDQTKNPA